jgi:hypothetical protein
MVRILLLEDDFNRIKVFKTLDPTITVTNTANDCIEQLKNGGKWDILYLDHDLGGEIYVDTSNPNTGSEVARWLSNNPTELDCIFIHSYNYPAVQHMTALLREYGYIVSLRPFSKSWERLA